MGEFRLDRVLILYAVKRTSRTAKGFIRRGYCEQDEISSIGSNKFRKEMRFPYQEGLLLLSRTRGVVTGPSAGMVLRLVSTTCIRVWHLNECGTPFFG